MKKITAMLLAVLLVLGSAAAAFAHGGRTDASGGHRDNKNASGLGSYHYHCGGYPAHLHTNGVCPYKSGSSGGGAAQSTASAAAVDDGGQITLTFAFGQRTGAYTGDMQNGLPHGRGQFTTVNANGVSWTYDGEWANGRMHGVGLTRWDTRDFEYGQYSGDVRGKRVEAVSDVYLSDKEIDQLFLVDTQELCGRMLSVSGKVAAVEDMDNADGDVVLTVKLTQPELSGERHMDLYVDKTLNGSVDYKLGQTVSLSGVYYGQRVIENTEPVLTYTYIPRVYVRYSDRT